METALKDKKPDIGSEYEANGADEGLRTNEAWLQEIIDGIPGMVVVLSPGDEVELANRQILEYLGKSLKELRDGTNSRKKVYHSDDYGRAAAGWVRAIETGQPVEDDYRLRRADGVYRWFRRCIQ